MKKFIITTVLAALPLFGFAQKEFAQFEDKDGIDTVIINEKLIDVLGSIKISQAEEAQGYLDKVKSLESLKIFVTQDRQYAKDMESTALSYLKKHRMEELMSVKKEGKDVKIYIVTGADSSIIKELLLYSRDTKDNETALVSFIGHIDLSEKKESK